MTSKIWIKFGQDTPVKVKFGTDVDDVFDLLEYVKRTFSPRFDAFDITAFSLRKSLNDPCLEVGLELKSPEFQALLVGNSSTNPILLEVKGFGQVNTQPPAHTDPNYTAMNRPVPAVPFENDFASRNRPVPPVPFEKDPATRNRPVPPVPPQQDTQASNAPRTSPNALVDQGGLATARLQAFSDEVFNLLDVNRIQLVDLYGMRTFEGRYSSDTSRFISEIEANPILNASGFFDIYGWQYADMPKKTQSDKKSNSFFGFNPNAFMEMMIKAQVGLTSFGFRQYLQDTILTDPNRAFGIFSEFIDNPNFKGRFQNHWSFVREDFPPVRDENRMAVLTRSMQLKQQQAQMEENLAINQINHSSQMIQRLNGDFSTGISSQTIKKLTKELIKLKETPPEGIVVNFKEENILDIEALIHGPPSTPYHKGVFKIKLVLGHDYPTAPPKGFDWKPDVGIGHLLLVIKCLLIVPNPESALNEEAGKLLLEDYEAYAKHARLMTNIHAINKEDLAKNQVLNSIGNQNQNSNIPLKRPAVNSTADKKKTLKRL